MPISVLNAGHGDIDTGAVANGLIERDINMSVAVIAKRLMEYNGIIVPPIISGSNLNEVIRKVNEIHKQTPVDIAHSIHHNAGGGDGSETIHSVFYGKATEFAKILEEEFDKLGQNRHGNGFVTKRSSDGIHDYHGFIRSTDPSAIISEFAFIDSSDYTAIDEYSEQYAEGEAIAKAHCRFYGITYKGLKSEKENKAVNIVVVIFSSDDYSVGKIAADQNGGCAIFNRNRSAAVHPDAMAAKKPIVIGGPKTGHPNEVYWSGDHAEDTAQAVLTGLKGVY